MAGRSVVVVVAAAAAAAAAAAVVITRAWKFEPTISLGGGAAYQRLDTMQIVHHRHLGRCRCVRRVACQCLAK